MPTFRPDGGGRRLAQPSPVSIGAALGQAGRGAAAAGTGARVGRAGQQAAATQRTVNAVTAPFSGGSTGGGSYGGGGGGGGSYGGASIQPMAAPVPPPPPSEKDFLGSDDVYLAALSRYNKSYEDLLADATRREGDYNVTYDNSLEDLGYLDGGGWDFENQQTAAGRGFQSLIQDFAARGLLHSGDYLSAQNDFTSQLGKQYDAMNLAKQQFGEGLNQERTTGQSGRDAGIGQARAEALARYAQLYGAV